MRDSRLFNVPVVGATGLVGEALCDVLSERQFPIDQFYPLASESSRGKRVTLGDRMVVVEELDSFDFRKADIALFSAGGAVSKQIIKQLAFAFRTEAACFQSCQQGFGQAIIPA